MRTARDALAAGRPVLVQVPRRGYVPALACAARPHAGPVPALLRAARRWLGPGRRRPAGGAAGRPADWRCPRCDGDRLRAVVVGSARTAEELGRAFPGVPVLHVRRGERVLAEVPDGPAVVVATPGAEPVAAGGYGAALLLDGWALLSRARPAGRRGGTAPLG